MRHTIGLSHNKCQTQDKSNNIDDNNIKAPISILKRGEKIL